MSGKAEKTKRLLSRHDDLTRDLERFQKGLAHYQEGDARVYVDVHYGELSQWSIKIEGDDATQLLERIIRELEEEIEKIEGALKMAAAVAEEMGL